MLSEARGHNREVRYGSLLGYGGTLCSVSKSTVCYRQEKLSFFVEKVLNLLKICIIIQYREENR